MQARAWMITGMAGLVCLVFAMLAYGGAAQLQAGVAAQARAESPLVQTYVVLDRYASRLAPGVGSLSRQLADACFADAWPAIEADPSIGLSLLSGQSRGLMAGLAAFSRWGAPVLLIASLVLYLLRPRDVHLIRH